MKILLKRLDQNVLKWFGHKERTDEGRLTEGVYRMEVYQGKGKDRPKIKWSEGIKELVELMELRFQESDM